MLIIDVDLKKQNSDLLASFGKGTMLECFQMLGILPNFKEWLNSEVMYVGDELFCKGAQHPISDEIRTRGKVRMCSKQELPHLVRCNIQIR